MQDLISRQAAIDAVDKLSDEPIGYLEAAIDALVDLPSAQPEPNYDEWCTDCKEYDKERHCCQRWNRVIRETLKDAQPEIIRCKDCRKHNVSVGYKEDCCALFEWRGVSYGHEHDYQYCCHAERRTDEQTEL